ncbi:cytochrome B [Lactococcus formosensis]|uniref:cytochrome B n=1 Tax=Lactococcus formosensis TaxID=1281486 RepID=UPI0022E438E0|nr:cytochrome B [Lactococcus formosensis]
MDEQTKYERFFVCSSMVLEKRGTISEDEIRLFFSSFCMTKRKIFCPFYFYQMGSWRLRKANRHNPKGIKGESETTRTKCFVLQCDSLQYLWFYIFYFVVRIVTA